jgi:hypothetical protein
MANTAITCLSADAHYFRPLACNRIKPSRYRPAPAYVPNDARTNRQTLLLFLLLLVLFFTLFVMNATVITSSPYEHVGNFVDGTCSVSWYHTSRPQILPGMSNGILAILSPVFSYWTLSAFYTVLDNLDWECVARHRFHEPAQATKKNLVSKWDVLRLIIFQQAMQSIIGYFLVEEDVIIPLATHCARAAQWATTLFAALAAMLGPAAARLWASRAGYFVYWWGVPIAQLLFAMWVGLRMTPQNILKMLTR